MQSLSAANWEYLRELSEAYSPRDPLLAALWRNALAENGQILRISQHRTVIKVQAKNDHDVAEWLLKIYHPRRQWEWLRRRFSAAPANREMENWRLLAHRLQTPMPIMAEQLAPALGLFARPYWSGRKVQEALNERGEAMQQLAQGIAHLHHHRWSDRDLTADDLMFVDAFDGELIPLDLGHAKVGLIPLSAEKVHLNLERLMASLPAEWSSELATILLHHHSEERWLKNWSKKKLIDRAQALRLKRTWKRSSRCLRTVSDFEKVENGARRRGFEDKPPSNMDTGSHAVNSQVQKSGARSTTIRVNQTAWKFYPRKGVGQSMRRQLMLGPGCKAYRKLYTLELLGFAVAKAQAWIPTSNGEWLATEWLHGEEPEELRLPEIAAYLARLHAFGVGFRDAKPSNFVRNDALKLIDADGIQGGRPNSWRDLGRVLAECDAQSDMETTCLQVYAKTWCGSRGLESAPWDIPTMAQKCEPHAQRFRGLLRAD